MNYERIRILLATCFSGLFVGEAIWLLTTRPLSYEPIVLLVCAAILAVDVVINVRRELPDG